MLNFKIVIAMKRLYFVCRMFVLSLFFVGYSCSSNVDDFSVVKKTEAQEVINEEEAYQNLILYLEQMDSLYNIKVYDESSRAGFFAKLWAVLKCDAMGYKWGVEHGQTWQVSLIISSVCSIIGIVLVATQSQFGSWDVNDNWQIYTPIKEWEKIGFEHNRLVQETVSKYPSIRSGNATPATILSNVELSASRLGISGTLSSLYRAELLAILNSQNFSTFEAKLE